MQRRLLRDGRVVVDDWNYWQEGADRSSGALILSFNDWLKDRDAWIAHGGRLGVILPASYSVERLAPDLAHFELIGAEFSGPGDGRGYTQARQLREQLKFRGELRATGYVRRDQLFFLARCGFNSFEMSDNELDGASEAFGTFSAAYQWSNDAGLRTPLRHQL
jgi:uncharacterized protein (DUF934 family)